MKKLLCIAIVVLSAAGVSTPVVAQAAASDLLQEAPFEREALSSAATEAAAIDSGASGSSGPRRTLPFNSIAPPFGRAQVSSFHRTLARPPTGIIIGGLLGGAAGFALGYMLDNVERPQPTVGRFTLMGTAVGVLLGGAVGSSIKLGASR